MKIKELMGAGHQVMLVAAPALAAAIGGTWLSPGWIGLGAAAQPLCALGCCLAGLGLAGWLWSVALILRDVPRGKLITRGPFRLVRHPLYQSIGLLLVPGIGLLPWL
jgi:protein-S-isoprenylcysteine O-methyltransferase Ste14